jgi:hypothetical protein
MTTKDIPNTVSILVVYTSKLNCHSEFFVEESPCLSGDFSLSFEMTMLSLAMTILNWVHSLLPIRFFSKSFIDASRLTVSSPSMSLSAYSVILSTRCFMGFCSTSLPQRSHFPSSRSSFASPVLQLGHRLIGLKSI